MTKKTAKEIYFNNFGNLLTMKRNGEYCDYIRKKASIEEERQWSTELKDLLIGDIVEKKEYIKVVPLSRINLPENEIIEAFKTISLQCSRNRIRQTLEQLQNLIPLGIYEKIILLFL